VRKKARLTEHRAGFAHLTSGRQDKGRKPEHREKGPELLAGRLKAGDRSAAAELVDIYYQQIYLFFRRLGHSCQTSEDLAQDCFLQAWGHIGQLRDPKALNGWLYRIAVNLSRRYWRGHKGRDTANLEGTDVPDDADSGRIENLEQLGQLRNAVAGLPIKLKQAVILHYTQQLTIAEAAEAAGIRQGTFKSRLSRALKALRNQVT